MPETQATRILTLEQYEALSGAELGVSPWTTITQRQIDLFAEATGDDQWIHVDPVRAAGGRFGGTIAHGYLTVALLPRLMGQIYRITGVGFAVNYGSDRMRYPSPVPVGSSVRARARLLSTERDGDRVSTLTEATVEIDGADKPACVAQLRSMLFVGQDA